MDKYSKIIDDLQKSPMFNLSLSSNELFHSNFLYWIWSFDKDSFWRIMKFLIGKEMRADIRDAKRVEVRREFKNFDLSIVDFVESDKLQKTESSDTIDDKDVSDVSVLLVIENKVKSVPYIEQIIEYAGKIRTHNQKSQSSTIVLLTLIDKFPDKNDLEEEFSKNPAWQNIDIKIIRYIDYIEFLDNLKLYKYDYIRAEYCRYVKNLIQLAESWNDKGHPWNRYFLGWHNDYRNCMPNSEKYNYHFPDTIKLRLHSLYHKLRSAELCQRLKEALDKKFSTSYNILYLSASDDPILIKAKQNVRKRTKYQTREEYFGSHKILIGVGCGYSNNQPILELKVISKKEDKIYIIQVQGVHYRHGIVSKNASNVKYLRNWMSVNRANDKDVIVINRNVIEDGALYPIPGKESKLYNKFGDIMVYQSRKLYPNVTNEDIMDYMVCDVNKLLEELDANDYL